MRKMNQAEAERFDGMHDHSNAGGTHYCCPACYTSSEIAARDGSYDDPDVVRCAHCGEEFLAWVAEVPVAFSAKLPASAEDD